MSEAQPDHPFAVLGLQTTVGAAQVKRAYFALLAKHPPHSDAAGFRRVRTAYERLVAPGGLERARATAPPEVAAELLRWEAEFSAALEAAARAAGGGEQQVVRFIAKVSRLKLAEAVAAFGS